MDRRVVQLDESENRIIKLFKVLQWVFLAFFVLYCAVVIVIATYCIIQPFGYKFIGPNSIFSIIPVVFNTIAGGVAIFVLWVISRKIAKGASPFTLNIATLFNVLAFVLLLSFLATLVTPSDVQLGAFNAVNDTAMAFESDGNSDSDLKVDVKLLIACIASFAMSAVFRYGAILQLEADDLV